MKKAAVLNNQVYLYIGSSEILEKKAIKFAQDLFCLKSNGTACLDCLDCRLISKKKYWNLKFISPKGNIYNLSDLEDVNKLLKFQLSKFEKQCLIIQNADLLSEACANSLLKALEEPLTGYYFLLLGQSQINILPTIRSRCIMQCLESSKAKDISSLEKYFTISAQFCLSEFTKAVDNVELSYFITIELLDNLAAYYIDLSMHNGQFNSDILMVLVRIDQVRSKLSLFDNYKLLLKNLFLRIKFLRKDLY